MSSEKKKNIKKSKKRPPRCERPMSLIVETITYISSFLELNQLLEKTLEKSMELVGAERGVFYLYSDSEGIERELEPKVIRNIKDEDRVVLISDSLRKIISEIQRTSGAIMIKDLNKDEHFKPQPGSPRFNISSILCLPVIVRNSLLGILYLDNCSSRSFFDQDDQSILEPVVKQAGVSIENALLFARAITDGLTGLYNHNFFEHYLQKNINEAKRYNKLVSLLMIDVDHFKLFNDRYGHQAGDLVLKRAAAVLQKNLRSTDLAARYGGEEFAIVLPETNLSGARIVAEKLRRLMEEEVLVYEVDANKKNLRITISVGAAQLLKNQDQKEFIEAADAALYKAKSLGRNRVEVQ